MSTLINRRVNSPIIEARSFLLSQNKQKAGRGEEFLPFILYKINNINNFVLKVLTFTVKYDIISLVIFLVYICDMGKRFYKPPRMVDYRIEIGVYFFSGGFFIFYGSNNILWTKYI